MTWSIWSAGKAHPPLAGAHAATSAHLSLPDRGSPRDSKSTLQQTEPPSHPFPQPEERGSVTSEKVGAHTPQSWRKAGRG